MREIFPCLVWAFAIGLLGSTVIAVVGSWMERRKERASSILAKVITTKKRGTEMKSSEMLKIQIDGLKQLKDSVNPSKDGLEFSDGLIFAFQTSIDLLQAACESALAVESHEERLAILLNPGPIRYEAQEAEEIKQ